MREGINSKEERSASEESWRMSIERWDPVASACSCHVSSVLFLSFLSFTLFFHPSILSLFSIQFDSLLVRCESWFIDRWIRLDVPDWVGEETSIVERGGRTHGKKTRWREERSKGRTNLRESCVWSSSLSLSSPVSLSYHSSLLPWQRLSSSAPFIDSLFPTSGLFLIQPDQPPKPTEEENRSFLLFCFFLICFHSTHVQDRDIRIQDCHFTWSSTLPHLHHLLLLRLLHQEDNDNNHHRYYECSTGPRILSRISQEVWKWWIFTETSKTPYMDLQERWMEDRLRSVFVSSPLPPSFCLFYNPLLSIPCDTFLSMKYT